jgi:hypothetical protein
MLGRENRLNKYGRCQAQWVIPIILDTGEAEMGRIVIQGQPGQIVQEIPSPKK